MIPCSEKPGPRDTELGAVDAEDDDADDDDDDDADEADNDVDRSSGTSPVVSST